MDCGSNYPALVVAAAKLTFQASISSIVASATTPTFCFIKRIVGQNDYLTACQSALFHVAKSVVLQTSYKGALNVAREPGYCLHKPTGQAYVRLGGKVFYLGEYGTDLSKQRYNRLKAEWLLNPHTGKFSPTSTNPSGSSMAELCLAYLDRQRSITHMAMSTAPSKWPYGQLVSCTVLSPLPDLAPSSSVLSDSGGSTAISAGPLPKIAPPGNVVAKPSTSK